MESPAVYVTLPGRDRISLSAELHTPYLPPSQASNIDFHLAACRRDKKKNQGLECVVQTLEEHAPVKVIKNSESHQIPGQGEGSLASPSHSRATQPRGVWDSPSPAPDHPWSRGSNARAPDSQREILASYLSPHVSRGPNAEASTRITPFSRRGQQKTFTRSRDSEMKNS